MKFVIALRILAVALLLSATGAQGQKRRVPKAPKTPAPSIMRIYDATGTRLIETVESPFFLIQPDLESPPNWGITSTQNGILLRRGAVFAGSGSNQRRFPAGEDGSLFRFENARFTLGLPYLPRDLATLVGTDWQGINTFSWFESDSALSLSMSDSLVLDRKAKTLEKTTESGTWTRRQSFKIKFVGVTPAMLDAVAKEPSPRMDAYCGEWGQEIYLPKYGVNVVEVLQTSEDMDFSFLASNNAKVRIVRRDLPRKTKPQNKKPLG